jgi:hypothetical protein
MTKLALCFALSLLVLGHVGPVLAAQMPEEFRGRWCGGAPTRPLPSASAYWGLRLQPPTEWSYYREEEEKEPCRDDLFAIMPTEVIVGKDEFRCRVIQVTQFDTCPWGQLSKRPSQRNPWGPGYNIKLQCPGATVAHDWVIEKGRLRVMRVPSGYRCLLPHPTKPDLP